MIDAGKFAPPVIQASGDAGFFRFSLDRVAAATELRRFADGIESGRILLQKVQSGVVASNDDYCLQALMVEFAEREVAEEVDPMAARKEAALGGIE
jgi:hypothetical protein